MTKHDINKRESLKFLAANGLLVAMPAMPAIAATDLSALTAIAPILRTGGCVVILRHAQTVPGIGDPPNFSLSQCSTQRNLSDDGKAQATRIGQWFKTSNLQPRSIQTSAWCRCKDTAELAFGRYTELAALNSTFENRADQEAQTKALRTRLGYLRANQFEVWVTHQVNITALVGEFAGMGEALVINNKAKVLARATFAG